ncbi:uncharacterized protein LOC107498777 isoform X2 [Rousettus aegyptiacus]|uniref:uncharacterized protein LOC107498777 isoform X2 n=1 Tax=Rousettus aegyptiacus TaxID=9407 RepID=UPI00168D396D|nr:uncharacterized protein LOC107498777 isoform X2 [Rousettus aegyptiacus]
MRLRSFLRTRKPVAGRIRRGPASLGIPAETFTWRSSALSLPPYTRFGDPSQMVDIQGCIYRILSGGVGMPGSRSEGLVQERDGRELQEPALPGFLLVWLCS